MGGIIIIVLIAAALFFNSGSREAGTSETIDDPSYNYEYSDPEYYDEYESVPDTYYGDECTDDCSGHEAGREWAEENGIEDPDDCGGNSDSFIEGCQTYAEEQQEYYEEEYDDEYYDDYGY